MMCMRDSCTSLESPELEARDACGRLRVITPDRSVFSAYGMG